MMVPFNRKLEAGIVLGALGLKKKKKISNK